MTCCFKLINEFDRATHLCSIVHIKIVLNTLLSAYLRTLCGETIFHNTCQYVSDRVIRCCSCAFMSAVTLIALLRGVNVGGSRCKMSLLKELMMNLGSILDAKTYLQSGNMVLRVKQPRGGEDVDLPSLQRQIGSTIFEHCGFNPAVLVLTLADFSNIVAANPFVDEANKDMKSVHVFLFSRDHSCPLNAHVAADQLISASEKYIHLEEELHSPLFLHTPDGFGISQFARKVEKVFGSPATARNWRSVSNVLALAQSCMTEWGDKDDATANSDGDREGRSKAVNDGSSSNSSACLVVQTESDVSSFSLGAKKKRHITPKVQQKQSAPGDIQSKKVRYVK